MGEWKNAVHCRNRAELLRRIADESRDDAFKAAVRNVAQHYEKMATSLESELKPTLAPT